MKQAFQRVDRRISKTCLSKSTQLYTSNYPKIVFREFMDEKHLVQDRDDAESNRSALTKDIRELCTSFDVQTFFHFNILLPKHVTENCTIFF